MHGFAVQVTLVFNFNCVHRPPKGVSQHRFFENLEDGVRVWL